MAKRRKGTRRRSPAGASSSSSSDQASAVSSLLPGGDEPPASSSSGEGEPGAGGAPPLPPDPGGDDPADGADAPGGDRPGSSSGDQESARLNRVAVLAIAFTAMFAALPEHAGGGMLEEREAATLAEAWEVPLRPYWDAMFGPWMGALLTTFAIVGPRVIAARAKLRAAGVTPGAQVG